MFSLLCLVLSCSCSVFVLFCLFLAEQTERYANRQTDLQTDRHMIRWKKMDRKLIVRDWNHNSPTWPKSFSRTPIVGNAITVWPIYDASIYLVFISLLQRVIFISGRRNWSGSLQNKLWWSNLVATLSSVSGYTLALRQFISGCVPAF